MSKVMISESHMSDIANAIRAKGGGTSPLTPAQMASAIAAISTGGGGAQTGGLAYDMGEFSLTEDTNTNNLGAKNGLDPMPDGIPHNLGDVPDFICVWTDHWAGIAEAPYSSGTTMVGFVWMRGLTGLSGRASASADYPNPVLCFLTMAANDYRLSVGYPSSAVYGLTDARLPDASAFRTPTYGTSTWWRAGVTYKYFVSKAWWSG